jgi:hypothetical protein
MRRTGIKPSRRREGTPSPSERSFVLNRDGECIARKLHWAGMVDDPGPCANEWDSEIHGAFRIEDLTYGHARTEAGGFRPISTDGVGRMFAVAECHRHNVRHWEARTDARLAINAYLDRLYPERRQHAS